MVSSSKTRMYCCLLLISVPVVIAALLTLMSDITGIYIPDVNLPFITIQEETIDDANSLANITDIWFDIFLSIFIPQQLKLDFNYSVVASDYNINVLLTKTLDILTKYSSNTSYIIQQSDNHLFRDLLSLRRCIMLLNIDYIKSINIPIKQQIYSTIFDIESKYNALFRNQYVILNLHPPRSAGTTICNMFKFARREEMLHGIPYRKQRVTSHPNWRFNCNYPYYNGQFMTVGASSRLNTSCKHLYQDLYNISSTGYIPNVFSMVSRESPLLPTKTNATHAELCDKFIYIFAFRSPFERIVSWLIADTLLEIKQKKRISTNKVNVWLKPNVADEILYKDFFYGLFSSEIKHDEAWNVFEIDDKVFRYNGIWLKPYANNLVTRWIGYQWPKGRERRWYLGIRIGRKRLESRIKYHMYNAIKTMLSMDYVLNFASYSNEVTKMNGYDLYGRSSSIYNKSDEDSMWNVFFKEMNKHYYPDDADMEVFEVIPGQQERTSFVYKSKKHPFKMKLFEALSKRDIQTLYSVNKYDLKLYLLSKWIEKVDVSFRKFNV